MKNYNKTVFATYIIGSLSFSALADENTLSSAATDDAESVERLSIIGDQSNVTNFAGVANILTQAQLEAFQFDNIEKVLAVIPGVNLREEDGFGLRPNIGFRGVTTERSRKINILEDGVLIGPAPYSAPAAYYFPSMSLMTGVEVVKGAAGTQYGPFTVAGSLNLITRPIPEDFSGALSIDVGDFGYTKLHAHLGDNIDGFAYLFEATTSQTDGFRELPNDDDTGFEKNHLMFKARYDLDDQFDEHFVKLKLGYSDEVSNETYTGITDADFAMNSMQRYAVSQNDLMEWDHQQVQISHTIGQGNFDLTTKLYRHEFARVWDKVDGFLASQGGFVPSLLQLSSDPDSDTNQRFYFVATGQVDSTIQELIKLGRNARSYYSQGLQVDGAYAFDGEIDVDLLYGIRLHSDEIKRDHTAQNYFMRSGALEETVQPRTLGTTNRESATAVSAYLRPTFYSGNWQITPGIRIESIASEYQNRLPNADQSVRDKDTTVVLPSFSVLYQMADNAVAYAGVHRGFIPTTPFQADTTDYEESINFELGYRGNVGPVDADVALFYTDYQNLVESCSISSGCEQNDLSFSGGKVVVYGLESTFTGEYTFDKNIALNYQLSYTYNDSEFQSEFFSPFNQWSYVSEGSPLPYLANHRGALNLALRIHNVTFNTLISHVGAMPESAQLVPTGRADDNPLAGIETEALTTVDIAINYDLAEAWQLSLKVDNLLDQVQIVSRRPYGARPTMPRFVQLGAKYSF